MDDRDQSTEPYGPGDWWGNNLGGDVSPPGPFSPREHGRQARRVLHPAAAPLDRLQAFRRSLAAVGEPRMESSPDFNTQAIWFVNETYLAGSSPPALEADVDLTGLLKDLPESEYPYWRAAVVSRARDGSARKCAEVLEDDAEFADYLGFDPDEPPSHTTLSRHWDFSREMETAIDEIALRARYHVLFAGARFPPTLRDDGWGMKEVLSSIPSLREKITAIQHLVEEGIGVMRPHLRFDRDPDAPAYKLTPTAFIVFFAHLALENSYAQTGGRTLEVLDMPAPVPAADTLFSYIRELTVKDIDEMFGYATAALLYQEMERSMVDPGKEALTPPIHLAYDTTAVNWYGDETSWTSGVLPTDNASSAWHFALLSIVGRDMSYVLGALPLQDRTEIGDYLHRFLRRASATYDLGIGRVYLDSELYTKRAIHALRSVDVDYLIQGRDMGAIEELLDKAPAGEVHARKHIRFRDYKFDTRPHAFAWPVPKEETGAENREREHYAFITDMDVTERDLEGLGQQFRSRWGIETSIREIKGRYHANCRHRSQEVRAFYFMMATVLYNLAQYVENRLEERLLADDISFSSEEFLHAVRRIDPDDVPHWGDTFQPCNSNWTTIG